MADDCAIPCSRVEVASYEIRKKASKSQREIHTQMTDSTRYVDRETLQKYHFCSRSTPSPGTVNLGLVAAVYLKKNTLVRIIFYLYRHLRLCRIFG